jgi:hypothetical protein
MVHNSFQRAKGNPGNRQYGMEAQKQRSQLLGIIYPMKSNKYKYSPMKTQENPYEMLLGLPSSPFIITRNLIYGIHEEQNLNP